MNVRVMAAGALLIVLAIGFFIGMTAMAPRSNDPAALMQTVGTVAGGAGGIGVAMVLFGALRRRR
ncbi:MAG TPA: hypothetical protein VMB84_05115 [Stellaceae bacterium]|nr:hypothetical protein [Stellaceae bacterium]